MWQPNTDRSVAHIKWPQDWHKWQLTLDCTTAPSKRPHTQHTKWTASNCTRTPPSQLHNRHIWRMDSAGTRAQLNWLPFRDRHLPDSSSELGSKLSQPVTLKVNLTYWHASTNQGPPTKGGYIQPTWRTPLEHQAKLPRETVPLGHIKHLT